MRNPYSQAEIRRSHVNIPLKSCSTSGFDQRISYSQAPILILKHMLENKVSCLRIRIFLCREGLFFC